MKTLRIRPTIATAGTMGLFSLALVSVLGGCDRTDKRDDGRTTTVAPEQQQGGASNAQPPDKGAANMQPTVDATTVERIANSRCEHEKTCNNIGGGKRYATHQICVDSFRASIGNELNSYNCPKGIARDQVAHCLAAIEDEACNHPLDTLQRVEKCRNAALCEKDLAGAPSPIPARQAAPRAP
jgi:hypothetical protein